MDTKLIDEHLLWVGKCVNQWAHVEERLFQLFAIALGGREDVQAIIFYRLQSFRQKLELTKEIVAAVLSPSPDQKVNWEKLCERIKKKSEIRNRAAHLPLRRDVTAIFYPDGTFKQKDTGYVAGKSPGRLKRPTEKSAFVNPDILAKSVRDAIALLGKLDEVELILNEALPKQPSLRRRCPPMSR